MPSVTPAEKVPVIPLKLVKGGYIHLHLTWDRGMWSWKVTTRPHHEICNTHRCAVLKVVTSETGVECEHNVRPPEFGEMLCTKCGCVVKVNVDLNAVNNAVNVGRN